MAKDFETFLDTFVSVSFLVSLEIDAKFLGAQQALSLGELIRVFGATRETRMSRASRPTKNSKRQQVRLFYRLPSFQKNTTHFKTFTSLVTVSPQMKNGVKNCMCTLASKEKSFTVELRFIYQTTC